MKCTLRGIACLRLIVIVASVMAVVVLPFICSAVDFRPNSVLASGKWVKVWIAETGLYGITYEDLKSMGFADPSRVGVYGKGGDVFSSDFRGGDDGVAYSDDLEPVGIIHRDGFLLFYGKGVESVELVSGDSPKFRRNPKNIYSDMACYFLTDKETPLAMPSASVPEDPLLFGKGSGCVYHEKDIFHNVTSTGQLFWGESLLDSGNYFKQNFHLPFCMEGKGWLDCRLWMSPKSSAGVTVKRGDTAMRSLRLNSTSDKRFSRHDISGDVALAGEDVVDITVVASSAKADFLNMDYFLLGYIKQFPYEGLGTEAQQNWWIAADSERGYAVSVASWLEALDVTDASCPKILHRLPGNGEYVGAVSDKPFSSILIYDPSRSQKTIAGWEPVVNSDLHARAALGADFLVVSVPAFRNYAEEIAELHRLHDGISVMTVTTTELYNEYSGGIPDAMAYRALARMLYDADGRLKNILLIGPSDGNMRRDAEEGRDGRIIAYQEPEATVSKEASPVYDFYGIFSDNVDPNALHRQEMGAGVGLLPCETDDDCRGAVAKIREYLEDEDRVWTVNETLTIGGLYDHHTHGWQASDFGDYINRMASSRMAHTTLCVDAYGNDVARNRFLEYLDNGKMLTVYFGHGSRKMLGKDVRFFTSSDVRRMENRELSFIYMGGCDFSVPDKRKRGLGDDFVLGTTHGMIAAVVSTRTTWSNQNYDLARRLVSAWFREDDSGRPPTIGEIYAKAKSRSDYNNSLCYVLIGDPALKVASPRKKVVIDEICPVAAGADFTVSGFVDDGSGKPDAGFNGKVVVKVMEPERRLVSSDYVTGSIHKGDTLIVKYGTTRLAAMEAEVSAGVFSLDITMPSRGTYFEGETLPVYAGVFDPATWFAGGGYSEMTVTEAGAPPGETDTECPRIDVRYDGARRALSVIACDNGGILLSGKDANVWIDGVLKPLRTDSYPERAETGDLLAGYVDLAGYCDGEHRVRVSVSDLAGNTCHAETDFIITPSRAPIMVETDVKAVAGGSVEFSVSGEFSGPLDLFVSDSSGNTVYSGSVTSSGLTWDCRDRNGNPVVAGLYRVMVKNSAAPEGEYSEWTYFAVLD